MCETRGRGLPLRLTTHKFLSPKCSTTMKLTIFRRILSYFHMTTIMEDGAPPARDAYLIVATTTKKMNVGMMIRSAVAFGVKEIIVAGPRDIRSFGDQGTSRFARIRNFDKLRDAVAHLKSKGVTICGIEITKDALPVQQRPFRGPTAFLPGAEGDGLCDVHKALCDHFVYIPHYGAGTASLNVTVATSIVLHHFGAWAGYSEVGRDDYRDKFTVVPPPVKSGAEGEYDLEKQATRRSKREAHEALGDVDPLAGGVGAGLALDGDDDEA